MNASRLAEYIRAMGLEVETEDSRLSASQYLTVWWDLEKVKIRLADHECRPTYGRMHGFANFEIGKHQDADGSWQDCLRWLAGIARLRTPRGCFQQAGITPVLRLKAKRLPSGHYRLARIMQAAVAAMSREERWFLDERLCQLIDSRKTDRGGWLKETPLADDTKILREAFLKSWL